VHPQCDEIDRSSRPPSKKAKGKRLEKKGKTKTTEDNLARAVTQTHDAHRQAKAAKTPVPPHHPLLLRTFRLILALSAEAAAVLPPWMAAFIIPTLLSSSPSDAL